VTACAVGLSALALGAHDVAAAGLLDRIKSEKAVRIAFFNSPPYNYIEGTNWTGSYAEIIKAYIKSVDPEIKIEGVLIEFSGNIPALLANRVEIAAGGIGIRPERCAQVAFTSPVTQTSTALLVPKGNPEGIKSLQDFVNRDLLYGSVRGAVAATMIPKAAGIPENRVVVFADDTAAQPALIAGRVHAIGTTTLEAAREAKRHPELEVLIPDPAPLNEQGKPAIYPAAMVVRKDETDFLDSFNAWLKDQRSSGQLLAIIEPFGFGETEIPPDSMSTAEVCAG
jgi:polar amino acid transport system substrate-binding protein